MILSPEELKREEADHIYWKTVAKIIRCDLIGWTYRGSATMNRERSCIEVPYWLAEEILELGAEVGITLPPGVRKGGSK